MRELSRVRERASEFKKREPATTTTLAPHCVNLLPFLCTHTGSATRRTHSLTHTRTLTHSFTYTHTLWYARSLSLALCAIFDHVSHTFGSPRTADFVPRSRDAQVYKSNRLSPDSRPTTNAALSLSPCLSPSPLCCLPAHTRALSYHICVWILASLLAALCSATANDLQNSIFGMEYNALWNDVNVKPGIKINTRDILREREGL